MYRYIVTEIEVVYFYNLMKITSFLFTVLLVIIFLIIFPSFFIYLNDTFHLPVYSNITLKIIGSIFILSVMLIDISSFILFKRFGQGTPVIIEPTKKLVIKGLYKYTRNPIYLGHILILIGEFLIFGRPLLLAYILLVFLLLRFYIMKYEEPEMERKFGQDYIKYKTNVNRWL